MFDQADQLGLYTDAHYVTFQQNAGVIRVLTVTARR
jgi:hypothetical protein